VSVFRIGGRLQAFVPPPAGPEQPPSWDLIDWDCSDEVGWSFSVSGTNSHSSDGSTETIQAGDAVVDADYCLSQKLTPRMDGTNMVTLDFKFKTTNLANYSSDNHMLETVFYMGNGRAYTWVGTYLDKVRYRWDGGDIRDLGNISPALSNGAWQYCRMIVDAPSKNVRVWFSTDNITYNYVGKATFNGTFTVDRFEIGAYESNGGGSLTVELDYVKVASGEWTP